MSLGLIKMSLNGVAYSELFSPLGLVFFVIYSQVMVFHFDSYPCNFVMIPPDGDKNNIVTKGRGCTPRMQDGQEIS